MNNLFICFPRSSARERSDRIFLSRQENKLEHAQPRYFDRREK
jgi:hypothetical protein